MTLTRTTVYTLIGAAVLVVVVGTTLGVVLSGGADPPTTSREKLLRLRSIMKSHNIDAYVIPSVDAHQSEYISAQDRRIEYVSEFTGSAGQVVVTMDQAALWTDSRYHIQAEHQLDQTLWNLMKSGIPGVPTYVQWLPEKIRVGIDPFLIDADGFRSMANALQQVDSVLVEVSPNLVDEVWIDKPAPNFAAIEAWNIQFSGQRSSVKIALLREEMRMKGASAIVVSALDDVAWLLNLRGTDIESNPVFFAYVLVTPTDIQLYILQTARITAEIRSHFIEEGIVVDVHDYNSITEGIRKLLTSTSTIVLLSFPNQALSSAIPKNQQAIITSPVNLMKIIKNSVEAEGMGRAHLRDSAALIKYFHWLEGNIDSSVVTELGGAAVLGKFRSEGEHFKGLSFTAISAVGANAAMAHYSPTNETDARITRNEVYLVDSGGQYLDGTTDITRTLHFGTPKDAERDSFTRVLKGFISIARATFPTGAEPSFLDAMARRALWDAGLNYGHGTGHGVGAYLNVHEYPPLISSGRSPPGMQVNMFHSNEPGYYEADQYGIRIEDVVQVVRADASKLRGSFAGLGALAIHDITLVPIQTTLIKEELLTNEEAAWLNAYHRRVRESTRPLLNAEQYAWLVQNTPDVRSTTVFNETCSMVC